jgi:hypothetical protein
MDLLNDRKNDELPIFRAFVERVLKKRAGEIDADINKGMAGFSSDFWKDKNFTTSDVSLVYSHLPVHRFVDMKVRKVGGKRTPKKNHEIHNRIIMGQFAGIQAELTYGLTEQVKEEIRNNIENIQF